jgi:ABC-type glycerol-3-phosphate transport system substrate-binding protein
MMKVRLFIIAALALVLTFSFASSGLYAADSISAYLGFSREVNEALSQRIQEKTGIEVKGITLSWGEQGSKSRASHSPGEKLVPELRRSTRGSMPI